MDISLSTLGGSSILQGSHEDELKQANASSVPVRPVNVSGNGNEVYA